MKLIDWEAFRNKSLDWYILTFLPILLIICLATIDYFSKGLKQSITGFSQQLLILSIIVSSTDFALRGKFLESDKQNRKSILVPLLPIIFAFVIYVIYVGFFGSEPTAETPLFIFLILSVIINCTSMILYIDNPMSNNLEISYAEKLQKQTSNDIENWEGKG